jgi:hypothetical protein
MAAPHPEDNPAYQYNLLWFFRYDDPLIFAANVHHITEISPLP